VLLRAEGGHHRLVLAVAVRLEARAHERRLLLQVAQEPGARLVQDQNIAALTGDGTLEG
jgi:hypothetical protein